MGISKSAVDLVIMEKIVAPKAYDPVTRAK